MLPVPRQATQRDSRKNKAGFKTASLDFTNKQNRSVGIGESPGFVQISHFMKEWKNVIGRGGARNNNTSSSYWQ